MSYFATSSHRKYSEILNIVYLLIYLFTVFRDRQNSKKGENENFASFLKKNLPWKYLKKGVKSWKSQAWGAELKTVVSWKMYLSPVCNEAPASENEK